MDVHVDEIRNATFAMHRRGYDRHEVDAFLRRLADELTTADPFEDAGQEIARLLRTAHDEAGRVRATAAAAAETIRTHAELTAAALTTDAEHDRENAKRLLLRSSQRAERLVAEAEGRAAAIVSASEDQARARVATTLDGGRRRLATLAREEHDTQERLRAAKAELGLLVQRLTGPGSVTAIDVPGREIRPQLGGATN